MLKKLIATVAFTLLASTALADNPRVLLNTIMVISRSSCLPTRHRSAWRTFCIIPMQVTTTA